MRLSAKRWHIHDELAVVEQVERGESVRRSIPVDTGSFDFVIQVSLDELPREW